MPYKNEITEEELYLEMKKYNQRLVTDGQELVDVWSYEETPIELKHLKDVNQVIGYIEIPDMKVKLPLLIGALEENRQKAREFYQKPVCGRRRKYKLCDSSSSWVEGKSIFSVL